MLGVLISKQYKIKLMILLLISILLTLGGLIINLFK
jgi:hypothetical protein